MKQFSLVTDFKGYRHREDQTNLPEGYMVFGSQNVLTNSANRISIRKGFTLDGQANTDIGGIESSYDWHRFNGSERNLRAYADELEYRFVDSLGVVTWRRLADGFSSALFRFAEFWDFNTEKIDLLLFVNGSSNIFEWSGGVTTFASATATTITKQGTTSWAEEGFYTAGARSVVIDGITYSYTGGESTTTLTGVLPDPTLGLHAVGAPIHQAIRVVPNSSMTAIPATFKNGFIANLYNQIYVGSSISREIYVSQVNIYQNFSFSTPRLVGEGALLTLDATTTGFKAQEDFLYISAGKDQWYKNQFKLDLDTVTERLIIERLKTGVLQGAKSQEFISKSGNQVIFLSNEPVINFFGRQKNIFATPDFVNLSDSIRDDMNVLNFEGGSAFFFQNFIYISAPLEGFVLIYNIDKGWWETPQVLPVKRFAVIDSELYGHSSESPETYKLFTGTSDNGNAIDAQAIFSYQHFGDRANLKNFDEYYVEGYISENTTLTTGIKYEVDGCSTEVSYDVVGTDEQIVCLGGDDRSLGKKSLGKFSLARLKTSTGDILPPKFRVKKTFPRLDFFEVQFGFFSNDIDFRWEILAFGPDVKSSGHDSPFIKQ